MVIFRLPVKALHETSPMKKRIEKVAVLGAGTMGARIAAQVANAGIPCFFARYRPERVER